jgi:hypothetical protein
MTRDFPDRAAVTACVAETEAEREACYALRYRVMVGEMKRDGPTAHHYRKLHCGGQHPDAVSRAVGKSW